MNLPAAIDPAVLFIGVIVISIINAVVKAIRGKSVGEDEAPDSARPGRPGETEQERMRKFLEALGVPSEPPPAPLPPVLEVERPAPPPPMPPAAPKPTGRRFTPPIMPGFPREAMTRLPREPEPPAARRHPWIPVEDEKYVFPPEEQEFPHKAMKRLPPERTSEFPAPAPFVESTPAELDAVTSRLADSFETSTSLREEEDQPLTGETKRPASLAMLLRDPAEQRKAILLREIFGPPRGLQSWS